MRETEKLKKLSVASGAASQNMPTHMEQNVFLQEY
jgi:hypothetical protein